MPMSRRGRIAVFTAGVSLTVVALAALSRPYVCIRPTVYSPTTTASLAVTLRPWAEHDTVYAAADFPYVFKADAGEGALLYIGSRHTSDAADPQLNDIERLWAEFKPTVALCEGRARMFRYQWRNQAGALTESDLTRILARKSGIPAYTLEPTYENEVAALLEHFEPRLVATYFTLRVFTQEAKPDRSDLDSLALGLMTKRTDVEGLRGSLKSIADLDAFWKERFAAEPDWRTLPDTEGVSLLNEVGDRSREVRGEHMVRSLIELVQKGERVLAVVGASHVIRQEPALRGALGEAGASASGEK